MPNVKENYPEYIRVKEACGILHLKRMTLYTMIKNGKLEAININKGLSRPDGKPKATRFRINKESVMKYIHDNTYHSHKK